ncbi:MAG TPA: T9SS type A sorting domain-containing protein [Saprospiraceae bacterium]|nr:T9SS type A sorting domain-containing protein [Saprospiraceae bacterium]
MKRTAIPFLLFLSFSVSMPGVFAQNPGCDGSRYKDNKFTAVKKTTVNYATVATQTGEQITLSMDVYEPNGDSLSARPVVVLAHGGSFIIGQKSDMKAWCERLAKKGYIAATIEYRLFPFFLLGLPDSVDIFDQAVRAVGDMKAAVRYFREDAATANKFRADAGNIFIGGYSAGAVAALHAGFLDSTDVVPAFIQTAIDANGGLNGNSGSASNQTYSASIKAVVNMSGGLYRSDWIAGNEIALVSIHGTADETVPFISGLAADLAYLEGSGLIHQKAETAGLLHNLHPVPGGGHTNIYEPSQTIYVPHIDSFWVNATTMLEYLTCQTVSTHDAQTLIEDWALFPNPATEGIFNIQLPQDVTRATVLLSDMSGKIVFQYQNFQNQGIVRPTSLPAGMYMVRIMDKDNARRQFATKKLVLGL